MSSGLPNSVGFKLRQHPELEVIALVRRSRQKQEIPRVILQRFGQLVVFRLAHLAARAVGSQVMRFVKHHQIPAWRIQQALDTGRALQGVDAGNQPVVFGEGIGLAVGDIAFGAKHLEIEVEHLVQFAVPVVHQACGHHHQRPGQLAPAGQFTQNQRGLDGFAQAHLVGDQVTPW